MPSGRRMLELLSRTRARHLELDATVLSATLGCLVVGNRLRFAAADGLYLRTVHALAHEVSLDRLGAALGELLVRCGAAGTVSVARDGHGFDLHTRLRELQRNIVELRTAFRFEIRLAGVEGRIRTERQRDCSALRRWRWRRHDERRGDGRGNGSCCRRGWCGGRPPPPPGRPPRPGVPPRGGGPRPPFLPTPLAL